jgi:hypothetical protein
MTSSVNLFTDPKPGNYLSGERLPKDAANDILAGLRQFKRASQGHAACNWLPTVTIAAGGATVTGMAYDDKLGMWAACWSAAGVPAVKTSNGGQLWTSRTLSIGSNFTSPILCSNNNGLFVMGCRSLGGATASKYMTSADGITWTTRTSSDSTTDAARTIIWVPFLSLFIATLGTSKIETSPDGVTWTARTCPITTFLGTGGADNGSNLVVLAGGSDGANIKCTTSPDGINWTARTFNAGTGNPMRGIVYSASDGYFYAVSDGVSGGIPWKSLDASSTWTSLGGAGSPPLLFPSSVNPSSDSLIEVGGALIATYTTGAVAFYAVSYDSGVTWIRALNVSCAGAGFVFGNGRRAIAASVDVVSVGASL